jgi:hypothetical protein
MLEDLDTVSTKQELQNQDSTWSMGLVVVVSWVCNGGVLGLYWWYVSGFVVSGGVLVSGGILVL